MKELKYSCLSHNIAVINLTDDVTIEPAEKGVFRWWVDIPPEGLHGLTQKALIQKIQAGYDIWTQALTNCTFVRTENRNEAHFYTYFVEQHHVHQTESPGKPGCPFEFDGPGNVLAHAFLPNTIFRGHNHYDCDEDWTRIDIPTVVAHEVGHCLGFGHIAFEQADGQLMNAVYRGAQRALGMFEKNLVRARYQKIMTRVEREIQFKPTLWQILSEWLNRMFSKQN